ncbi:MAG: phosphoribosyltransferase family protein [Infirmifilum sp.]
MVEIFQDRLQAGLLLGEKLLSTKEEWEKTVVLGIPRGGAVTALGVSKKLKAPLSIIVSRKLRAPGNPELGIGAVSEHGALWLNHEIISQLGVGEEYLQAEISFQQKRVSEYIEKFRGGLPLDLSGHDAIIVDDGVATGATIIAAAMAARKAGASRVIVATPVIAEDVVEVVAKYCDLLVWVLKPLILYAVGMYYSNFSEVKDEEVLNILNVSHTS